MKKIGICITFFFAVLLAHQATLARVHTTESPAHEPALAPLEIHLTTTRNIVAALQAQHFAPTALDDALSSTLLDAYLEDLDSGKNYFLASDIEEFEPYRFTLDDSLRQGNLEVAFYIFNQYRERVLSRFKKVVEILETNIDEFDFSKDESLLLDPDNLRWAQTPEELDDLWRRHIKAAMLNLKLAEETPEKIQELLVKRFTNRLHRSGQTNSEDVYQVYMNSFTRVYDPHTQYFSPRNSENFDINMSLSLEGIGAVLQLEDEYTKVVSLVPAGPADKAGQLQPDDRIVAVGQGDTGELADVIGWRLDEVVQLIRGKKGTQVRLAIIPEEANYTTGTKVIHIIRNRVELKEQAAKSDIIEIEQHGQTFQLGVIDIPTFYVDFKGMQRGDHDFKSTTRDVKQLLADLVAQEVDGIVIDLRNNGGGSLQEARTLTGLFIDRGPAVQVRGKRNRVNILVDQDGEVTFEGPLVVLVNRLSASASEIFAGAMQDYQRGLVIGSQTFGKGTVQTLLPLKQGQLKLTQAKFYRISGESTQHRGIIPDISYPSTYDPDHIGESTLDRPLPWDQIRPASYQVKKNLRPLLPELQSLHQARVSTDPEFNYSAAAFAYRKAERDDQTVNLNEAARLTEKQERDAFWVALENTKRLAQGLRAITSLDDLDPEEATLAAPTKATPGGAIVPEINGSDEGSVSGSEMAGMTGASSEDALEGMSEGAAEKTSEGTAAERTAANSAADANEPPDAYVLESGRILLDLIALEAQTGTASQAAPYQDGS